MLLNSIRVCVVQRCEGFLTKERVTALMGPRPDNVNHVLFFFPLCCCRMKRKFYSWEECMNLREVKVLVSFNG